MFWFWFWFVWFVIVVVVVVVVVVIGGGGGGLNGFLCVDVVVLKPTMWTRLALNSEIHLLLLPKCWD